MGKSGDTPQAPDPTKLIPVQAAADKNSFNYQTAANRFNSAGPDVSQTWQHSPVFDQAGYDAALKNYMSTANQGTFTPGQAATPGTYDSSTQSITGGSPATQGSWSGATGPTGTQPTPDDYTTQQYSLNTQLSPQAQALHDATQGAQTTQAQIAQALAAKLGPTLGGSLDLSGAPALSGNPGTSALLSKFSGLDPTQFSNSASDAAYQNQTRYLDPQVADAKRALEAHLAEQGFTPGTPGYAQAMQQFGDTNNKAYGDARDNATLAGFNAGHTQFSDAASSLSSQIAAALQSAQFGNSAHQTGVQDLLAQRAAPRADLSTLLSGLSGGNFSAPTPQGGVGSLQNPDQLAAYNNQYQQQLGQYNAGVASDNNTTSTIGGLVGAIAIAF